MELFFAITSFIFILYDSLISMKHIGMLQTKLMQQNNSLSKESVPISVLICLRGESPYFSNYIIKYATQDYHQQFEVIIVYHEVSLAYIHEVMEKVEMYAHIKFISLDINSPYIQKKQALNYGMQFCQYDWVVTSDDDCYPATNQWLTSIASLTQTHDIILGISPYISQKGILNKWIRYDWLHGISTLAYSWCSRASIYGVGRNMAFKKNLWSQDYLHRYGNIGQGDDTTLVQFYQDSKSIGLMHTPAVYTMPKHNLWNWIIQKNRHHSTASHIAQKDLAWLAKLVLPRLIIYLTLWVWLTWYAKPLWALGGLLGYWLIRFYILYRLESLLFISRKISWYVPLFDHIHSLYLSILSPLLVAIMPKKWK